MYRDESPLSQRLTDMQLEALDILSEDCGITNRKLTRQLKESDISSMLTEQELTKSLERIEKSEGNVFNKVTKPLLEQGMIYQVKGEKYPNKLLYINKSRDNMLKIQHDLADPLEGRIWYYDRIHYKEQTEFEKRKWDYLNDHDAAPDISDKHAEARSLLMSFIHLYLWCDKIYKEIHAMLFEGDTWSGFSLVTQIPPCMTCQEINRRMKSEQYHQESMRVIYEKDRLLALIKARTQHGIRNVKELQSTAGFVDPR